MTKLSSVQDQLGAFSGEYANVRPMRFDIRDWMNMFDRGERFALPHDTLLLRQGDRVGAVYFLVDGEVRIERRDDGKKIELARLGPGAVIGEMSLLTGAEASADVIADGAIVVARLEHDCLACQAEQDPEFGMAFYGSLAVLLARRLDNTNRAVAG